jgi:hypothetical protein
LSEFTEFTRYRIDTQRHSNSTCAVQLYFGLPGGDEARPHPAPGNLAQSINTVFRRFIPVQKLLFTLILYPIGLVLFILFCAFRFPIILHRGAKEFVEAFTRPLDPRVIAAIREAEAND